VPTSNIKRLWFGPFPLFSFLLSFVSKIAGINSEWYFVFFITL
jgi:hypothetical protein